MTSPINIRQKKFVNNLIETGLVRKSAQKAYNLPESRKSYAQVLGSKLLKKPQVRSYLQMKLEEAGLSDNFLADRLKTIIDGGTTSDALRRANPADALRGIELANRLKDNFPTQRSEVTKKEMRMELDKRSSQELIELLNKKQQELNKWSKLLDNSG